MKTMKKSIALSVALLVLLAIIPVTAIATEKTVGTFKELVDAIGSADSVDTIIVSNNIQLNGEISIPSDKDISIKSSDGNNFSLAMRFLRHIIVYSGATLTLTNLTLDGGNTCGGILNFGDLTLNAGAIIQNCCYSGGGIYNEGTLTVNLGAFIQHCDSTNTYYNGGGICNRGIAIISGGSIIHNTSDWGGGIYNSGTLIVKGGEISDNSASAQSDCVGGGIYNYTTGTVTISGGIISGNTAKQGGGIDNQGAITISGGEIRDSMASSGGGIFNSGGTITINGGKIRDNMASGSGGGIYNKATITVNGGEIRDNSASSGGGIYNDGNSIINGCEIKSNSASKGGGVFTNYGRLTVEDCKINCNEANYGGGIYNYRGINTIRTSFVSCNSADDGGGIYNTNDGVVSYLESGTIAINSCIISDNSTTRDGGGIWTENLTRVTTSDTIFSGNIASQAYWMTDESDIATHKEQITRVTQSLPPTGNKPFEYTYNNYDINYTNGLSKNAISYKVTGAIKSYNPNNPITILLMQDNQVMYKTSIDKTTGFGLIEQQFTIVDIEPGTYTLAINKAAHTPFTVQGITVIDEDVNLISDIHTEVQLMTLRCGDINEDGLINDGDLTVMWMLSNYNRTVANATNPLCDLNGDGMINDADLTILWLASNYNHGAITVPCTVSGENYNWSEWRINESTNDATEIETKIQ